MDPVFSLCVATLGVPSRLEPFLDSLAGLRVSEPWEILLVFNTVAAPPPLAALRGPAGRLPLTLLHEPRPGKSRALNRALAAARGEWLVFTDDDVTHDPEWLNRLRGAALAQPWARVLGGRIEPRGEAPAWIRHSANLQPLMLVRHDLGAVPCRYPPGQYPFGPNLAVARRAVEQAGARWPEAVGPGTSLPVGDEAMFLAQVSGPNDDARAYVPDALVFHAVESSYFRLDQALRRAFLAGVAAGRVAARFGAATGTRPARRIAARIRGLRSARELLCVCARAAGVLWGRLT